jgi:hypothetical protein
MLCHGLATVTGTCKTLVAGSLSWGLYAGHSALVDGPCDKHCLDHAPPFLAISLFLLLELKPDHQGSRRQGQPLTTPRFWPMWSRPSHAC